MTVQISVFHNISRDASFGLNTVFRTGETVPAGRTSIELTGGRSFWKEQAVTPDERHELVFVFRYEQPDAHFDKNVCLNRAFETFNIGTDELAVQYRARKLRSLNVGDVVAIDGQPWSCESAGWKARDLSELNILPAREADKVIRERYEFRPAEDLRVTVPLPD